MQGRATHAGIAPQNCNGGIQGGATGGRIPAKSTASNPGTAQRIELGQDAKYSDVIDVEGAMTWVGDDIQMYRRFLASFLADVRGNADQLQAHFERGEQSDAARVLHTLKGLARTVGALELSRFAAETEIRLKHPLTQEDAHMLVTQVREQIENATQALLKVAKNIDASMDFAD